MSFIGICDADGIVTIHYSQDNLGLSLQWRPRLFDDVSLHDVEVYLRYSPMQWMRSFPKVIRIFRSHNTHSRGNRIFVNRNGRRSY